MNHGATELVDSLRVQLLWLVFSHVLISSIMSSPILSKAYGNIYWWYPTTNWQLHSQQWRAIVQSSSEERKTKTYLWSEYGLSTGHCNSNSREFEFKFQIFFESTPVLYSRVPTSHLHFIHDEVYFLFLTVKYTPGSKLFPFCDLVKC